MSRYSGSSPLPPPPPACCCCCCICCWCPPLPLRPAGASSSGKLPSARWPLGRAACGSGDGGAGLRSGQTTDAGRHAQAHLRRLCCRALLRGRLLRRRREQLREACPEVCGGGSDRLKGDGGLAEGALSHEHLRCPRRSRRRHADDLRRGAEAEGEGEETRCCHACLERL